MTDFYLKEENFDKIKKSLEAKGSNKTKEDVDQYNKSIKDINTSVNSFNQLNQDLNKHRQEVVENWENAEKSFRDDLIPYYK
jgi:seryl-tRNA synthetase